MGKDKFWGGRFEKEIDKKFFDFQKSIDFDWRLAKYDLYHSLVHVEVLKKEKIIKPQEAARLRQALKKILKEVEGRGFRPLKQSEDIHTEIHNRVSRQFPRQAEKLHSLRSRNDQIVFDEKMFLREEAEAIKGKVKQVRLAFQRKARLHKKAFFISFTHTQRAQIIYFSQYLLAWYEFFSADEKKLNVFRKNLKLSLGAGAGSGVSLTQKHYQESLRKAGFGSESIEKIRNPLYTVSDRDFLIEFLFILSLLQMHLSRFCEDLIIYSSREFDYIELPEEFCTGSSLMPHKKNPDFLELVRGNTALVYSSLNAILVLLKSLPLAYNRDLQLDKNILFPVLDIIHKELDLLPSFVEKFKLKKDRINKVLREDCSLYATELAELLVRKGVSFSRAHRIVGGLILYLEKEGKNLAEVPSAVLRKFHPYLSEEEVKNILNPAYILRKRES